MFWSIAFGLLTLAPPNGSATPPTDPNFGMPIDGAVDTICSHPARAGIRARLTLLLDGGGAAALERRLDDAAESSLGMSTAGVGMEDPSRQPIFRQSDFLLQSPQVSVVITIRTNNRNSIAHAWVERTCINDDLEDWRPFWRHFRILLRGWGYRIQLGRGR